MNHIVSPGPTLIACGWGLNRDCEDDAWRGLQIQPVDFHFSISKVCFNTVLNLSPHLIKFRSPTVYQMLLEMEQ